MLDGPAPARDRSLGVRGLVRGKHLVDGGVADGMRRHPPLEPIQLFDHIGVRRLLHRIDAAERAALTPRFGIRLAHPAAFESAIHGELHAADTQPVVAFIRFDRRRGKSRAHGGCGIDAEPEELIDTNRQQPASPHVL